MLDTIIYKCRAKKYIKLITVYAEIDNNSLEN